MENLHDTLPCFLNLKPHPRAAHRGLPLPLGRGVNSRGYKNFEC